MTWCGRGPALHCASEGAVSRGIHQLGRTFNALGIPLSGLQSCRSWASLAKGETVRRQLRCGGEHGIPGVTGFGGGADDSKAQGDRGTKWPLGRRHGGGAARRRSAASLQIRAQSSITFIEIKAATKHSNGGNGFGAICMCRVPPQPVEDFLRPRRGIATRYLDNYLSFPPRLVRLTEHTHIVSTLQDEGFLAGANIDGARKVGLAATQDLAQHAVAFGGG